MSFIVIKSQKKKKKKLKFIFILIKIKKKKKKKKSKGTLGTFQKPDYSFLYDPFIKLHKVFMKIIEIYAH